MEDAIRYYEKAMALMETDVNSPGMLITCYTALGLAKEARRAAQITLNRTETMLAQDDNNGSAMGYGVTALVTLGEIERAKQWINRALLIDPDNMNMRYNFACALTAMKDTEAAIDILRPVFETAYINRLNHAKIDPDLDPLREDPRFKAMIAAVEERLAVGEGNPGASQGGNPT
jgi:adenylate cyclase